MVGSDLPLQSLDEAVDRAVEVAPGGRRPIGPPRGSGRRVHSVTAVHPAPSLPGDLDLDPVEPGLDALESG
jgi:hypothetical protein